MVDKPFRVHLRFEQIKSDGALPEIGPFDAIFLHTLRLAFHPRRNAIFCPDFPLCCTRMATSSSAIQRAYMA